ncbi:MAG: hypothetical protein ACC663_08645 [Gammaproteobacteria bacterium]
MIELAGLWRPVHSSAPAAALLELDRKTHRLQVDGQVFRGDQAAG